MNLFRRPNLLLMAACCLATLSALCTPARATSIQENYGTFAVNFLTATPVTGTVPGFNPALGTLDTIQFSYSASAVLFQGTALGTTIAITDPSNTTLANILFPEMTGRAQQTESGAFSIPQNDLVNFESASPISLILQPRTACRGSANTPSGCSEFSGSLSGQVTYNYTPAPLPTPEAGPLPLLATGAVILGCGMRRRRGAKRP